MAITTSRAAFDVWLAEADADARRQRPAIELLAEHHVMSTVLGAMEAEAQGMLGGRPLRLPFWSDVVDFNGNFVHLCHRVKEEVHLIPMLTTHGLLAAEQETAVRREHETAKSLTLDLCDGVECGDWERVLRVVSIYTHILRPHMRHEEAGPFAAAVDRLPLEAERELRRAFDAVDVAALGDRGRRHYVALARRLAEACGLACDL